MKLKHSFTIFGLVAMLGLGVGVRLASRNAPAKEAEADVVPSGYIRVYFDANNISGFFGGGCTLRIHYWGAGAGKETTWSGVQMTNTVNKYSRDIYYYDVPNGTTGCIFGQYANGAASNANPNVRWDVSADSDEGPDDGYNFFQPKSWNAQDFGSYTAHSVKLIVDEETIYDVAISTWGNYVPYTPADKVDSSFVGWYEDEECTATPYVERELTADLTLYAKFAANTHLVTKSIWYDDVYQSYSTENVEDATSYTPAAPSSVNGYHFDGWYWRENDAFTTKVGTVASVTTDLTIHARFISRDAYRSEHGTDKYIYYIKDIASAQNTPDTIYTYGGENEFGSFAGQSINSYSTDVHGSLGFRGWAAGDGVARKIYKIPYNSIFGDTHVIIAYDGGGSGKQTSDLELRAGAAYYWDNATGEMNADAGAAIDLLLDIEAARNAVTTSGGFIQYSVCGIAPATAAALYLRYEDTEEISATAKGYIDASFTFTYTGSYDGEHAPAEGSVSYADIMDQLYLIAMKDATFRNNHSSINMLPITELSNTTNSTVIIIIAISVGVLLVIGGYFYLRKRKEDR